MKKEKEFFIWSNSFAAPFFSDEATGFITASTAEEALVKFAKDYSHPAGLYAANVYACSDDYHKRKPALAEWRCNHEIARLEATKGLGSYSFLGERPGRFRVNDDWFDVKDPKLGRVI